MFVGDEVLVDVAFPVARERLARLAAVGTLAGLSEDVYDRETAGLARVGAAGVAKLVRVHVRELAGTDRSAGLAMAGVYRPPFGALGEILDRAVLHRVAAATVRGFVAQVAARITGRPGSAQVSQPEVPEVKA